MALLRIVTAFCALVNELEAGGVPERQLARLDRLIDALVALALPTIAANDVDDGLCPTCGAPLVPADETTPPEEGD
jgi:hypothetical protein